MNYLITHHNFEPFYTNWFEYPNHYLEGMTVFNLLDNTYTTNGIDWKEITEDHL